VSIRFDVYPLVCLVRYTANGPVTPDDARQFLDGVLAHRHFDPGFDFLGDAIGAGRDPDAVYTAALAHEVRARAHLLAPCRWAVVVPTPGGLALVRLWAPLTREGGVEVAPFRTADDAMAWLGPRTAVFRAPSPAH
jgi:hypothetical protein